MKRHRSIMGMPVTIEVCDREVTDEDLNEVFSFFHYIDKTFSTYKKDSEISRLNNDEVSELSNDMKKILQLSKETKQLTLGYFDIDLGGKLDPSGIVKGYAISEGAKILRKRGLNNFFVEIAGDIQTSGKNTNGDKWSIGIQNPFNLKEIVKVVFLTDKGIATSGNYRRGEHIYDPIGKKVANEVASVTVVADDIFDADRFATAAFAMGVKGINFLERLKNIEGYLITKNKRAIFTSGFDRYTVN